MIVIVELSVLESVAFVVFNRATPKVSLPRSIIAWREILIVPEFWPAGIVGVSLSDIVSNGQCCSIYSSVIYINILTRDRATDTVNVTEFAPSLTEASAILTTGGFVDALSLIFTVPVKVPGVRLFCWLY